MSSLSKLFKPRKDAHSDTQKAIQKLRDSHDMLTRKSEFLEKKIDDEIALAKKCGTKNKRAALKALSRKRGYERQLQNIDGILNTLDSHIEALENAGTNMEVLNSMRYGASSLKAVHKNMKREDVDKILDELQEQRDITDEIANLISTPFGMNAGYDEDDLIAELEALEAEGVEEKLLEVGPLPSLPSIPDPESMNTTIPARKQTAIVDDDLDALAAWAE